MGARAEQRAFAERLRADGAAWAEVVAAFRSRWALNARQAVRLARGWSQQQVADEWCRRWPDDPKSFKNISTWERWPAGGHAPSLVVLDRLARIYRCSVSDLVADFPDHGIDNGPARTDDRDVDRRTMLAGLGSSLAVGAVGRRRVTSPTPETLDYLDAQLSGHWHTDRTLGPHVVIDTATSQCSTVLAAVDATVGADHRRALELATAYSGFLGWLHQDAGDLTACTRWLDVTLELAHRSGDPQLVAYALTSKAMVRVDARDGTAALDLTNAALAFADRLPPKARAMAVQQAALGHALVGDRAAVDRQLDELGTLLDVVATERQPWGGDRLSRTPDQVVQVQRATCYGTLGLHDEAAALWDEVWQHAAAHERRDAGVYLARHAAALVDAGHVDHATPRAIAALDHHRHTGSARLGTEIARLRHKALPWALTPAGRDLNDALAIAG